MKHRALIPIDSRLEGGVNRAKLKFTNINTTTSRVSVRNINESAREGAKQKEDQTLTRDTYPWSGRIEGWLRTPADSRLEGGG